MEYTHKTIEARMQLSYEPTQASLPHNMGGHENRQDAISSSDQIQVRVRHCNLRINKYVVENYSNLPRGFSLNLNKLVAWDSSTENSIYNDLKTV